MVGFKAIQELLRIGGLAKSALSESSYADYTAATRVEPTVLIDYDVSEEKSLTDILYSIQSIITAYYLQAFALSNHTINGVAVIKTLDRLNPNRSAKHAFDAVVGLEDFKFALPVAGRKAPALEDSSKVRTEPKDIIEATNLAVGKMVTVTFMSGDKEVTLPISIRLNTQLVRSDTLKYVLGEGKKDTSFAARWDGYRSGRLSGIGDMILCNDLVDAHRKRLLKDPEGLFSQILAKRRSHLISGVLSQNISVAAASNILIMSDLTLAKVENELGGSIKDVKTRNALFEDSSLMLLVIIEKEWNRVRIYTRGIAQVTQLSVSALAAAGKGKNGVDILEVLKAFQSGNTFSL